MHSMFHMIDVGRKSVTHRIAIASGTISVGETAFEMIKNKTLPKGDVLILAEVAGIIGAKKASEQIPLCHPMFLDQVKIITELQESTASVRVYCIASTHAKTGIEMEVLAGVNAALLAIWDLAKMIEPNLLIESISLLAKKGGKSGVWLNPKGVPEWVFELMNPPVEPVLKGKNIFVVTISDRAYNGVYEDLSGPMAGSILESYGADSIQYKIVPDEKNMIRNEVSSYIKENKPALIICTGGTGVSERDITPEAIEPLLEKEIPGVGEFLRKIGADYTPFSWSSRSISGIIENTVVITLPGNPSAVKEGLGALLPDLIPHLIRIVRGDTK